MKHYSKEEFKRRIKNFEENLKEQAKWSRKELLKMSDENNGFFEIGRQSGKADALEMIRQELVNEFQIED